MIKMSVVSVKECDVLVTPVLECVVVQGVAWNHLEIGCG